MSLIRDIRQQSHAVRIAMFALSLMTTLSLVGLLWVGSFQRNLYALINTPTPDNANQLAKSKTEEPPKSPFAFFMDAIKNTTGSILGLLSRRQNASPNERTGDKKTTRPYTFPLSDPR